MAGITLLPLTRMNWQTVLELQLKPEQQGYMPGVLHSLAESAFEPEAEPFGLALGADVIGFALLNHWSGPWWITRIMIDQKFQGFGYGQEALDLLIELVRRKPGATELRTTLHKDNLTAKAGFEQAGFRPMPELQDGELVMQLILSERVR